MYCVNVVRHLTANNCLYAVIDSRGRYILNIILNQFFDIIAPRMGYKFLWYNSEIDSGIVACQLQLQLVRRETP